MEIENQPRLKHFNLNLILTCDNAMWLFRAVIIFLMSALLGYYILKVSTLVILHEEAEDGKAMPDLALPVQAVGTAVQNLVKVCTLL